MSLVEMVRAHLAVGAGALVGVVLVLRHVELLAFSVAD
jgi:hypothetical protein